VVNFLVEKSVKKIYSRVPRRIDSIINKKGQKRPKSNFLSVFEIFGQKFANFLDGRFRAKQANFGHFFNFFSGKSQKIEIWAFFRKIFAVTKSAVNPNQFSQKLVIFKKSF